MANLPLNWRYFAHLYAVLGNRDCAATTHAAVSAQMQERPGKYINDYSETGVPPLIQLVRDETRKQYAVYPWLKTKAFKGFRTEVRSFGSGFEEEILLVRTSQHTTVVFSADLINACLGAKAKVFPAQGDVSGTAHMWVNASMNAADEMGVCQGCDPAKAPRSQLGEHKPPTYQTMGNFLAATLAQPTTETRVDQSSSQLILEVGCESDDIAPMMVDYPCGAITGNTRSCG